MGVEVDDGTRSGLGFRPLRFLFCLAHICIGNNPRAASRSQTPPGAIGLGDLYLLGELNSLERNVILVDVYYFLPWSPEESRRLVVIFHYFWYVSSTYVIACLLSRPE